MRKKIMIMVMLLVGLMAISVVGAADAGEDNLEIDHQSYDGPIAADNGTFTALQDKISNADEGSIIELENDYTYDEGFDAGGIQISKAITLDGKGYKIDANSKSKIFDIKCNNVVIKNLNFKNGYGDNGGAIHTSSGNCVVNSCSFTNCSSQNSIAVNFEGNNGIIDSCNFTDCKDVIVRNCTISSCTFKNSKNVIARSQSIVDSCIFENSKALHVYNGLVESCIFTDTEGIEGHDDYLEVNSCSFTNCKSTSAGAIHNQASRCRVTLCNFTDSDSNQSDISNRVGAICNDQWNRYADISIDSCIFKTGVAITQRPGAASYTITSCSFTDTGSIYTYLANVTVDSCSFTNSGPISAAGKNCTIVNCNFTDCSGPVDLSNSNNAIIGNCDFINCSPVHIYSSTNCLIDSCSFTKGGIDCSSNNIDCNISSCVFTGTASVFNNGKQCNINSCNFTNCKADYRPFCDGYGGAVYTAGNCTLDSCIFESCQSHYGGAVSMMNALSDYRITSIVNCKFIDNFGRHGGAVYSYHMNCYIENSTFISNSVKNDYKEAAYSELDADDIASGGAIYLDYQDHSCQIINSGFIGNSADGSASAIFSTNNHLTIRGTAFEGNAAKGLDTQIKSYFTPFYIKHFGNGTITVKNSDNQLDVEMDNVTGLIDNSDIFRPPTKIVAPSVSQAYNEEKYLIATLKDYFSRPMENCVLEVNFNGETYNMTTDKNGQVRILVDLAMNTYSATFRFDGDNFIRQSSASTNVAVTKATPKLTAKAATFKVKTKTKKYTVTLKDNKNKVMKSTYVSLKVNKKTYKIKTNSKGQATFKITNLKKKGTYKAVVSYSGSKYIASKTVKPKITVK